MQGLWALGVMVAAATAVTLPGHAAEDAPLWRLIDNSSCRIETTRDVVAGGRLMLEFQNIGGAQEVRVRLAGREDKLLEEWRNFGPRGMLRWVRVDFPGKLRVEVAGKSFEGKPGKLEDARDGHEGDVILACQKVKLNVQFMR